MRKPWIAPLFVASILVGCTPPEERAEDARASFAQALERGDRAAALKAAAQLRESLPDTPEALLEVAGLRVQGGDAPKAGWLLEEGVRRYPQRADLRLALARVSLLLGNPSRAREVVGEIPRGSPEHAASLVLRAQAELNLGELEPALETLTEAERLYPERPEARLVRIATLFSERRQEEARAALEEARASLAGDAEETVALRRRLDLTLAQIQAQQGDTEAALAGVEALIATDPSDVLAWRVLVQVLVQEQRGDEALARLEPALAGDAAPPELYPLAAQIHAGRGDEAKVKAQLRAYFERATSAGAVLPLVTWYSQRGDAAATTRVLDEALARFPEEPMLRVLRVEALLSEQRLADARAELGRFRKATFAGDPQIDYLEARLVLADGDAAGAAEQLRELAPRLDTAQTQFWLGRALEESGDSEGARRRYGLAQQRDPSWTAPASALIALEQRRGDWHAVAAQAQRLLARVPQELGVWTALVVALENLGEGEAAEEVAKRCLEVFPDDPLAHALLARALRAQGRHDEALAALATAEASGTTPALEAERILTLGMAGRVAEGIEMGRAALVTEPDSAELHAALASLLFAAGAAEEGARETDRALVLAPDEPRPLRVRCEFRASVGRWAGARDDCTRYLVARPDDAGAHFMLGVAEEQLGERAGAAAAYRRAAQLDERDFRPRNNLAELLAAEGDLDGALVAAQEAYRLEESNPYVMDTLGALYLRKGLVDRAVSLLEEAHAAAPGLPDATLHLALAYRDAGRVGEARALLEGLQANAAGDPALRERVTQALVALP